jgi:hypothetical protein
VQIRVIYVNGVRLPIKEGDQLVRCAEHKVSKSYGECTWSYGFDANMKIYTSRLLTPKEYDLMLVKERL